MIYVDTSVIVPLCVLEPKSASVAAWYEACEARLVSAFWCATEFASALAIKQRTKQLTKPEAQSCWKSFERLCAGDLELLPLETAHFFDAAARTRNATSGLRSGDALHLAVAVGSGVKTMATLDKILAVNAKRAKLKLVAL
jgi:predicted nucleic acid-binding protein